MKLTKSKTLLILVVILIGISILILTKNPILQKLDESISLLIFPIFKSNQFIIDFFRIITDYTIASLYFVILLGIFFLITKRFKTLISFVLFYVVTLLVQDSLKYFFQRVRPYNLFPEVENLTFIVLRNELSFPSGHATSVFFIAFFLIFRLDKKFNWLKILLFIGAILVSVSRIVLGVHFFSDVLAGGILGILIGEISVLFENKIDKT